MSLFNKRFIKEYLINGQYDIDISNKFIFCKHRNTGYNLRKNGTQILELMVLNSPFDRIINELNGLPNRIYRESNSVSTFKRNVLSFIKNNYNIDFYICIYFSYTLIINH